jgi:hypothetical protein
MKRPKSYLVKAAAAFVVGLVKAVDYGRRLGRRPSDPEPQAPASAAADAYCRSFFDDYLTRWTGRPLLPDVRRVNVTFEVRVTDLEGFRRIVEVRGGELVRVGEAGAAAECVYEMGSEVFRRIAAAELDPREAFFARRTEIRGDVEAGLRLAALMVEFFRRNPYGGPEAEPWSPPG